MKAGIKSGFGDWLKNLFTDETAKRQRVLSLVSTAAVMIKQDDLANALATLEEALRLDPNCGAALVNKGAILGIQGQHFAAYGCFVKAMQLGEQTAKSAADHARLQELRERRNRSIFTRRRRGEMYLIEINESGDLITSPGFYAVSRRLVVTNRKAEIAAFIQLLEDGRIVPNLEPSGSGEPDAVSALYLIGATAYVIFSERGKQLLAEWARLPPKEWSTEHRQVFILAYLHHLQQKVWLHQPLPEKVRTCAVWLENAILPNLPSPVPAELSSCLDEISTGLE